MTLEERVYNLEVFTGINAGTPVTLTAPIKDSVPVMNYTDTDIILSPYTPVRYDEAGDYYEAFYFWNSIKVVSRSRTGRGGLGNWYYQSYPKTPTGEIESIIKVGNMYYNSGHYWSAGLCYSNFSISPDGITWTVLSHAPMPSGEDRSLFHDGTKFICYIRTGNGQTFPRKIGMMTSTDFKSWSPITEILAPDNRDGAYKQLYNLAVCKNGSDWWGLLNVIETDSGGKDLSQTPPYATNDNTVGCQLVYSTNGINWQRCKDNKDFIPRIGNVKQLFGMPTMLRDKLLIYTFENDRRHTMYDDANKAGRYWKVERYEISLAELNKYKPGIITTTPVTVPDLSKKVKNLENWKDGIWSQIAVPSDL